MKAVLEGFASVAPRRFVFFCCCWCWAILISILCIYSVVPNLIDLLGTLLGRAGNGTGGGGGAGGAVAAVWMKDILFAVSTPPITSSGLGINWLLPFIQENFIHSKATPEVKEKFVKAVMR